MTSRLSVVVLLCFCCLIGHEAKPSSRRDYTGYKVLEIIPQGSDELAFLHQLMVTDHDLFFWSKPSVVGRRVQLMISPDSLSHVEGELKQFDMKYTVLHKNVQSLLEPVWQDLDQSPESRIFELNKFNTLTDINQWMTSLVSQCRAGLTCQMESLGPSHDIRPVNIFRISKTGENRKAFYIDATTQSTDWISTSTALNILDALARGTNEEAIRLTDEYDWHILPVVNPDGYQYTMDSDRFWLKNRKPNGACYGTNLNVNFDSNWGNEGVSHSPCNNAFCGTGPASEPETSLVQVEIRRLAPTLRGVLSLHAYGNTWTFPWAYSVNNAGGECALTSDNDHMMVVAKAAADAAGATYTTTWQHGSICQISGPSSGNMNDFAKRTGGVTYSFMIGLRGDSFVIDSSEISPAYTEMWNGLVAMVDAIVAE